MTCFVVFEVKSNKQIRVFPYSIAQKDDRQRMKEKAIASAKDLHNAGYPCIVEDIGISGVGSLVYSSEHSAEFYK